MLPVSLPGTFIGLAMILAFNDGLLEMTGTLAIIILGMALRQLPVGYRQAVAGLKQIEGSLEQASTNLGAGSFTTFPENCAAYAEKIHFLSALYTRSCVP